MPVEVTRLARAIEQLARQTGVEFDPLLARDSAVRALRLHPGSAASDRFEQLVAAASECSLRVTPVRLPLADVVWRARPDAPIVAVTPAGEWLVFARRGLFNLRLGSPDGRPGFETIRREALARQLGLGGVSETADFALVQPERPASGLSSGGGAAAAHDAGHSSPKPHHRLLGLMRPEMPDVWAIVLFSIITGILYLAVPLTVDAVVNNIAFGGQEKVYAQALVILSVALLAFLGLLAFVRAVQYYLAEIIQRRIFVRLAADLAYRLPRVTAASTDRMHAPELVNRFFDVITVQKSTSLLLLEGVNLVLSAIIGMVVLGFYHPSLLAFDLVLLSLVAFIVFGLGRGAVQTSIRESVVKYAVAGWLEAVAHFPNLFKNPGAFQLALDRADALGRRYLDARKAHFRILIRQVGGLLALQAVASSALLVVGGVLVLAGELTLGQLVASEIIVTAVVASVAKLGKHLEGWYDAMAAVDKLGYLVDLETEREMGDTPADRSRPARVEVRQLGFSYDQKPVLAGVDFTLEPGARAAFLAPFGAGSSTLLDLIHGLREATEGHVLVDGIDLRQWSLETLRHDVILVRDHDIIEGTVLENLRLGRVDIGLDEVREALASVGLLEDVLGLPEGLETPLILGGRPLTQIQRTRLVLARAIMGRPRLLLLDQILDGIDPAAFAGLAAALFASTRPWSVLVATRDPDVIRHCQQLIRLGADGRGTTTTFQGN